MFIELVKRQNPGDQGYSWWFSSPGETVKYAITGGIVLLVLVWIVAGTVHAKSRLAKGLQPLAYHRCLVPSAQRRGPQPTFPSYARPYRRRTSQDHMEYSLGSWSREQQQPPPPNYYHDVPPAYQPAGSKADPGQSVHVIPLGDPTAGVGRAGEP